MKKNEINQQKRKPGACPGRRPGGQPGNQNARIHGFYSKRRLSLEEHRALEAAAGVSGLDYEIALLRAKVLSIMAHDPDNISLLCLALKALAQAVKARQQLETESTDGLEEVINTVFKQLSLPPEIEGAAGIIAPPSAPPRGEAATGGGEAEGQPGGES